MQADFEFHINGLPHRAGGASASLRLLDYLRDSMLTSAKDACGGGGCGACSVLVVDGDAEGEPTFRVVNACLLTLPMVAGRQIWTAEALGDENSPHPVSEALAACAGDGCGFCLPGVSVALCEAYERGGEPLLGDAVGQTIGNLCRCTGYRPFRDALIGVLRARVTPGSEPTPLAGCRPASFTGPPPMAYRDAAGEIFYRPETMLEALRLRQAHPEAKLLAGGTSRGWADSHDPDDHHAVISLESIIELSQLTREEDHWRIGPCVTIGALAERMGEEFPMVREMAARFGSQQIRNRATVGGNLAGAAHHSDLAPVLLALDATARIEAVDGGRDIELDEFFVGFRQTALGEGEILASLKLPRPEPVGTGHAIAHRLMAFYKVSKRRHLDRAIANAGFLVELDGDGVVSRARIALGGVAAYAARAYEAETLLEGELWDSKIAQTVAATLKDIFPSSTDLRATAAYRNALAAGLWQKFFAEYRDPAAPVFSDASLRRFLAKPVVG